MGSELNGSWKCSAAPAKPAPRTVLDKPPAPWPGRDSFGDLTREPVRSRCRQTQLDLRSPVSVGRGCWHLLPCHRTASGGQSASTFPPCLSSRLHWLQSSQLQAYLRGRRRG